MGLTIAQKIIKSHLISGDMTVGSEVALRIDQTLTQDATGTMAYLEFEAMGIDRVRTERSVAYIDHNTLQSGFENADDHRFIQSIAKKHGISPVCSLPMNPKLAAAVDAGAIELMEEDGLDRLADKLAEMLR